MSKKLALRKLKVKHFQKEPFEFAGSFEMKGKGKHFKKVKKFGGHSISRQESDQMTRDKIRADYD